MHLYKVARSIPCNVVHGSLPAYQGAHTFPGTVHSNYPTEGILDTVFHFLGIVNLSAICHTQSSFTTWVCADSIVLPNLSLDKILPSPATFIIAVKVTIIVIILYAIIYTRRKNFLPVNFPHIRYNNNIINT